MASSERYASIHYIRDVETATEDDLSLLIQTFPILDNHCHPMLKEDHAYGSQEYPFECVTSEAQGHALHDHVSSSLAHMRGIKQLSKFFGCSPTLKDVKDARHERIREDYTDFIQDCLQGTHALLLDDGLTPEVIKPVSWHEQFVPTAARIVRIEAIASDLLEQLVHAAGLLKPGVDADWTLEQTESVLIRFNTMIRNQIKTLARDPGVRGFKSVVCYRSGLEISLESRRAFKPHSTLIGTALLTGFHEFLQTAVQTHNYRMQKKEVNDFLVVAACDVLEKLIDTEGENVPIQFHTGLGDNDIDLIRSNPAYMQPLIEAFPNVDFIILHSSYPYTKEAGYLATVYSNAWLDIGEVYPMLSREGGETVLREALELCPTSKILWSTDGHFFPETYYLSNIQFRATLEKILLEYVKQDDLSISQAIRVATDILFWNSNFVYKLEEERDYPELLQACGRAPEQSLNVRSPNSNRSRSGTQERDEEDGRVSKATTLTAFRPQSKQLTHYSSSTSLDSLLSKQDIMMEDSRPNTKNLLDEFMSVHPELKYIWLQFIDYTGTVRNRMVPIVSFVKQIQSGESVGITCAMTRLLQNEWPAKGCIATGEFLLDPDLSSICINKGIDSPSATISTWWLDSETRDHYPQCPRWTLQRQINLLESEYKVKVLLGFEIEIIFMRPTRADPSSPSSDFNDFQPLTTTHSWSNMTHQQLDALPLVEEIVDTLSSVGIDVPQFHSEAAPAQWEFPLPAYEPVKSVDTLYRARDIIRNIARKHGFKATLYPRPYAMAPGSASHAHFSLHGMTPSATPEIIEEHSESFLAGVLAHLPSILSLTLPLSESYARIAPGVWAGSIYVAWGTQNREVPVRKCGPAHWELKTIDGIGNMYLSMAALLASGILGLRKELPLTIQDTPVDASTLDDAGRRKLGIDTLLPDTLSKSMKCLKGDADLVAMLGQKVVDDYLAVKEAEMQLLDGMEGKERRVWLMSRY